MSDVYFIPKEKFDKNGGAASAALQIFKKLEQTGFNNYSACNDAPCDADISNTKKIGLKVHFGEEGNITYLRSSNFDTVIDYLQEKGFAPSYIETNVLYRGMRMKKKDHISLALSHGFTHIPIIITDGEIGENYQEIEINKKHYSTCKIASGFKDFEKIIVFSHFKGHLLAGFGGALKQLGMGFASRGGKLAQHVNAAPLVKSSKCVLCGTCITGCPANALCIDSGTITLDKDKCIGCAACVALCSKGVFAINWGGSTIPDFRERLAEYAFAALQTNSRKTFITFASDITRYCDCDGTEMTPLIPDIGVFGSHDPVSIDAACMDMADKQARKILFQGRDYIEYASEIGAGEVNYNLITL